MVKIFSITILFLLFSINCNCQTLPLNSPEEPNNGAYLKDIDNVLPFWVGTWKGTMGNKEYTFQFTTFLRFSSERYYYIDELLGKFKVVDLTTNTVLYDDLNVSNFEDYKISLSYPGNNIGYVFSFDDDNAHCNNSIEFTLTIESYTYAIKINDVVKFYDFMEKKYTSFKARLEDKYAKKPDNLYLFPVQSVIEKEFLKILNNKEQSGISLYILNDAKTNWDELMLNPLFPNSNVKRKPCNTK